MAFMISPIHRPLWAEISAVRFVENLKEIRRRISPRTFYAVMKADAYGHGAEALAPLTQGIADAVAVASVEEALRLRGAGFEGRLLVLGYTPPAALPEILSACLEITLLHLQDARAFGEAAARQGHTLPVHVKIDTGMSRLGVPWRGEEIFLEAVLAQKGLKVMAAFSHLAASDDPALEKFTRQQTQRLMALRKHPSFHHLPLHLANSGAVLNAPGSWLDGVRPGILCYGLCPTGTGPSPEGFAPVMRLLSRVVELRTLQKGDTVSYARTFTAKGPRRIATLPVGYADGILRSFSGRGEVLVGGQRAPMVGRVCMDFLMVDVTGVQGGVMIGQEVVLFGEQEGQSLGAGEAAQKAGTINYELVSLIGKRVPRVLIQS